jgi:signal transduction histidine kinase
MKPLTLLLIGLVIFMQPSAQTYNKDSVLKVVKQIRARPVDTLQVRLLRELGYDIGSMDSALAKEVITESLEKSLTLKDGRAITSAYRMLGLWYSGVGDLDNAIKCYRNAQAAAQQHDLPYLESGAYFNMGNIKYYKGEYDSSIYYYLKTQDIFERPDLIKKDGEMTQRVLDKRKSDLYSNISSVFNTLGNFKKSNEYIDKALAIARSYNAKAVIAQYIQQKADNLSQSGEVEQALRARLQHLPDMEASSIEKPFIQTYYHSIARDYEKLEKIDSAKIYAGKGLALARILEVPDALASANLLMGRLAVKEKNFTVADSYLSKAIGYYSVSENQEEQREYYDVMQQLHFGKGDFKSAYEYLQKYQAVNDTILNGERTRQFSEREARYQSEVKDAQIAAKNAAIKQKNLWNILLGGSLAALVVIGLLSYRNYRHKQSIQRQRIVELETEKQLAATESVLKGEEQERTRLAKDLHDGLGGMLSGIKYSMNAMKGNLIMTPENASAFERSMEMLDSSIHEMRRVAHNLMPEALVKFGLDAALRDFCNDISQSGVLSVTYQSVGLEGRDTDQSVAITIYRIVQELLNNTMKHASAQHAVVQVSRSGEDISITVEDDGKGFDTAILQKSSGIGWSNIRHRVELMKGKMDVLSSPGKGTSVYIELLSY